MTNRWHAEAAEGIRYFIETVQDMLFTLKKKVAR